MLAEGVAAQTHAAITNAEHVLATAGLTLDEVLRCVVYIVDMADFEVMNAAYETRFRTPPPARTTIAVAGLPLNARIEIEMTASRSAR
ncbi:RidA family protein [Sphingomonas sp. UYP23]